MRYGYWLPVFGGWLRNVENENMETSWAYVKKLAQRSERIVELAGVEVGGIEYVIDDRTGRQLYYDVNALSNFVADPVRVIGFNPYARLADFLIAEAQRHESNRNEHVAASGGPR